VTGTTYANVSGGVRLRVYVQLVDARASTTYDVYVDTEGGSAGAHVPVGSFTTDAGGNATFTGEIVVPSIGTHIDNEVVLDGNTANLHEFIRESFTPCAE
jgi:hypothetical protein